MASDAREILTILKTELAYLEQGGYRNSTHAHWYPKLIFQDSPTCLNFHRPVEPRPCSECPLMQFVPSEHKSEQIPCRHIPLNERGVTLDSMYRSETPEEVEATVAEWLRTTIKRLESEQIRCQLPSSESEGIAKKKSAND